jgi:hypothetical protein
MKKRHALSLVEQALNTTHSDSKEEVELAVAFFGGEVTASQAAKALHATRFGAPYKMANILRRAISKGRVRLNVTKAA